MIRTIIDCDCGCKQSLELGEGDTPGAEQMLQITDAMSRKYFFLNKACLVKWLEKYECPYPRHEKPAGDDVPPEAMPELAN